MIILGLAGPKQGGKDKVAHTIAEEIEHSVRMEIHFFRFADPLKDMVAKLFGWDRLSLDESAEYKETPDLFWNALTPRRALQAIGTDMLREGFLKTHFNISIWVQLMQKRIQDTPRDDIPKIILIPDCRFHDELDLIRDLGGRTVFVDPRPRIRQDMDAHSSEQELWTYAFYDYRINSGAEIAHTIAAAQSLAHTLLDDSEVPAHKRKRQPIS